MKHLRIIILLIFCALPSFAQKGRNRAVVEANLIDAVGQIDTNAAAAKAKLLALDHKYPGNDAVNYYLGLINYAEGNLLDAEKYLKTATSLDSTNVWYWDALAGLYTAQRRGADASKIYLRLLEKYPAKYSNSYTLSMLGDEQLGNGQDSLAFESYEKALRITPGYAPALLGKAEVYRIRNNVPAYFTTIDGFVRDDGILAKPKCDYVNQLLQHVDGNFYRVWHAQLDSLVNACVQTHPGDTSALQLAGSWYYGTGRKDEAMKFFNKMIEDNPQSLEAHYLKMQLLYMDNDLEAVIKECEKIVELGGEKNSKVLPALATIGDCWHELGNDSKSFKAYDRVLKLDPEYLPVLNNYAYHLCITGRQLKKAEKMSRITIEKEPDNPTYLDTYAWILHLLGRDQEAKPYFKHAIIYGGKDNVEILEHYAAVLEALGESDLAQYYRGLAQNKQ